MGAAGGPSGCGSSRRSLPRSLLVQGMAWPGVLSVPGKAAWEASFATGQGQEAALGALVSVPPAERRSGARMPASRPASPCK